jgi:hypothetical protein
MTEWYVVSKATKQIVNCITTSKPNPTNPDPEKYDLTRTPSQQQLNSYRYYWERP